MMAATLEGIAVQREVVEGLEEQIQSIRMQQQLHSFIHHLTQGNNNNKHNTENKKWRMRRRINKQAKQQESEREEEKKGIDPTPWPRQHSQWDARAAFFVDPSAWFSSNGVRVN